MKSWRWTDRAREGMRDGGRGSKCGDGEEWWRNGKEGYPSSLLVIAAFPHAVSLEQTEIQRDHPDLCLLIMTRHSFTMNLCFFVICVTCCSRNKHSGEEKSLSVIKQQTVSVLRLSNTVCHLSHMTLQFGPAPKIHEKSLVSMSITRTLNTGLFL